MVSMASIGIDVGIPILRGIREARETVHRAINLPAVNNIFVSINDDYRNKFEYLELESLDPRVKIFTQESNLGLWGNFQFLVHNSKSEYFAWICVDDQPHQGMFKNFEACVTKNPEKSLFVGAQVLKKFSPETLTWNNLEKNIDLEIDINKLTFSTAIQIPPSMIFGIWRKDDLETLVTHMAKFDWGDSLVLAQLFMQNKIALIPNSGKSIIGVWNLGKRDFPSLNRKWPNPLPSTISLVIFWNKWSTKNCGDNLKLLLVIYERWKLTAVVFASYFLKKVF